jgi:hypothetical protein
LVVSRPPLAIYSVDLLLKALGMHFDLQQHPSDETESKTPVRLATLTLRLW